MKKLLLLVLEAILPAIAFCQYLSKEFTLDDSDVTTAVAINVSVSKDSTFTLPLWAPQEEDGDDSDCTKGPIDEFGNLQIIAPDMLDTIFIDTNTDYDTPKYINQHIRVYEDRAFTISNHIYCNHGVSITLERDSYLYVEGGGVLENVILKPQPGSHIIIDNGCIKHNKAVNFKIPLGVTLEQKRGTIK